MGSDKGGIDLSQIELTLSRQGILSAVGIPPLNEINLAGKDEKFVSSLNPADLKVLRAAKALKDGWDSLSLLYVHEIMLLLKDNIISDIDNKNLLFQVLEQLRDREFLDPQALNLLELLQTQHNVSDLKMATKLSLD